MDTVENALEKTVIFGLTADDLIGRAIMLAVAVLLAVVVAHFLTKLLRRLLDVSEVPSASIFVNIARALVWAFALLAVLDPVFGVQPTAFVTALGVTSLVISFGLQDTVSNVIGGWGSWPARWCSLATAWTSQASPARSSTSTGAAPPCATAWATSR